MGAVITPPETRMILENISWSTYQGLLADHPESANPRFTYDEGALEIMVLSAENEDSNRTLAALVEVLAEEFDINLRRVGSNTFQREDLLKGFEPDSSFYFGEHARLVCGKKRLDLAQDPPPDLVIEIDVTNPSLPRFPIFAAVGVPEVWRFDDERVRFFTPAGDGYAEVEHSVALTPLTGEVATRFLRDNDEIDSTEWMRNVRAWARAQTGGRHSEG